MKKSIVFFIGLVIIMSIKAQDKQVQGKITSVKGDAISILRVYPDSFPFVSVLLRALAADGRAVWDINKSNLVVKENGTTCKIVKVAPLSEKKPIQLSIVIDHSYSMVADSAHAKLHYSAIIADTTYKKTPLWYAKEAVKKFVRSFKFEKDEIAITGFSSFVDKPLPLSGNAASILTYLDSLEPDGRTALYDAMAVGMQMLKKASEFKVLIVLTDGQDNVSHNNWQQIIDLSLKEKIPVYMVGLGEVNKDTLQLIADRTKGRFFYANTASSLDSIYQSISKQLQSFYDVVYESENLKPTDDTRTISISFENAGVAINSDTASMNVPVALLQYLHQKQQERTYWWLGGTILVLVLAGGATLRYTYNRKKQKDLPKILKLYPNPVVNMLNLETNISNGHLQIFDSRGMLVKEKVFTSSTIQMELSDLKNGLYIATILVPGSPATSQQFIISNGL